MTSTYMKPTLTCNAASKTASQLIVLFCLLLAVPWSRSAPVVDTVTKLTASDARTNLFFGTAVAIDSGLAAVGAPDVTNGAVYTYTLVGGNWVQTQKLTDPAPPCGHDLFGTSVAMQDGLLVVGQPESCSAQNLSGQVFIYKRVGATWVLQQTLTDANEPFLINGFGDSVALSGNTIVVGNPNDPVGPGSGAVSIFTNNGTSWNLQAKVTAPSNTFQAFTGAAVAIEGDMLIAGAPGVGIAGGAFVFLRTGSTWTLTQTLLPVIHTAANFGASVSFQGGVAVIGAPGEADTNGVAGGAAFVYRRVANSLVQQQELTPTANVRGLGFGTSVSVLNGTIVVGIPFRTVSGQTNAGAADIFTVNGTGWTLAQEIAAFDASSGAQFGHAVDIGASGIIVGAPFDSQVLSSAGAAYIFSESNQLAIVTANALPNVLFPPNHKLVPVTISMTTQGNDVSCKIVNVSSNQPINGTGDGNTSPDWIITGDLTLLLRAERAGNIKTDRVYTITVQCTDTFGNTATTTVTVTAPHDQGK
jgi:hypothetical protein